MKKGKFEKHKGEMYFIDKFGGEWHATLLDELIEANRQFRKFYYVNSYFFED
jgi:hypothetical protein